MGNFNDWWNNYYFISSTVLKLDYDEFLNSTPRQVNGLDALSFRYNQNLLIDTYIKLHSPVDGNTGTYKTNENIEVDSFTDLLM